ncbi:MAG: signal peptidase II [Candidatus Aegiribacteria sp.]|nr:signal peptidase II [Candidatus Aegiribacteria sp.]MBD3295631.1 signal peptidase II [Candidatus Fermentibacteria bacterium]
MKPRRIALAGYAMALATAVVDQISKRLALASLEMHQPVEVIGDLLRFTFAWNRGAAFSLPWAGPTFLAVITAAAVVAIGAVIWKYQGGSKLFLFGLGLVMGGALGNLLDRFFYGKVADFIDVGIGSSRWPTFNVADIAITAGGILLILLYKREPGTPDKEEES